jgi:hypothetical protein
VRRNRCTYAVDDVRREFLLVRLCFGTENAANGEKNENSHVCRAAKMKIFEILASSVPFIGDDWETFDELIVINVAASF